jgi:hypothetical protein
MTTSRRETVMMTGRLKGMGREAECTIGAVMISPPLLDTGEYVDCDIYFAPEDLPDGKYEVTFESRTTEVKKLDGEWLDGRF